MGTESASHAVPHVLSPWLHTHLSADDVGSAPDGRISHVRCLRRRRCPEPVRPGVWAHSRKFDYGGLMAATDVSSGVVRDEYLLTLFA